MRKKWILWLAACAALFLAACGGKIPDSARINNVIEAETYVKITLGDAYYQEKVYFDRETDRAVVPSGVQWGLEKYRAGTEAGVSYGEEEGVNLYDDADEENTPELYIQHYFDSIRGLELTVGDIRKSGYNVRIGKKEKLELFEEELSVLSGMVAGEGCELAGVEIQFDKKFRPVKKVFHFRKKDEAELDNEEDSTGYTQKYSYKSGEIQFNWLFDRVKKRIQNEA